MELEDSKTTRGTTGQQNKMWHYRPVEHVALQGNRTCGTTEQRNTWNYKTAQQHVALQGSKTCGTAG